MGVSNVVIVELSERVIHKLVSIIQDNKDKEEKTVRKICEQCIRYISYRKEKEEDSEKSIETLQNRLSANSQFYTLLLAILYDDIEDDEQALNHYSDFSKTQLAAPFREDLEDYILMARFFNMEDTSALEQVGLAFIERHSEGLNIPEFLYQLSSSVEIKEQIAIFQSLINKTRELYPEEFSIESFQGYLFNMNSQFDKALETLLLVKENLSNDTGNPLFNLSLASTWNGIAYCYIKLNNAEKALESCETALTYNHNSEDISIEHSILCKKADALLLKGQKEEALEVVNKVLEEMPDDAEALDIMERIK
jgi:tetratricopeptide (TPR) repeat protein